MTPLAAMLGRFAGAVLAECAPVLVEIISEAIRNAMRDTVETSKPDLDLQLRLRRKLAGLRDANDSGAQRDTSAPASSNTSEGVGPG